MGFLSSLSTATSTPSVESTDKSTDKSTDVLSKKDLYKKIQWGRFDLEWVLAPKESRISGTIVVMSSLIAKISKYLERFTISSVVTIIRDLRVFGKEVNYTIDGKSVTMSSHLGLKGKNHFWGDSDIQNIARHLVENNSSRGLGNRQVLVDLAIEDYVSHMDKLLGAGHILEINCSKAFKEMLLERYPGRPSTLEIQKLIFV